MTKWAPTQRRSGANVMRLSDTPEARPATRKAMIGRSMTAQHAHIPYFISFSGPDCAVPLSFMFSSLDFPVARSESYRLPAREGQCYKPIQKSLFCQINPA